MTFLSWTGSVWVRIPLETHIFILNFSLPPGSEQVNGAVANEIKHVHSPEVIVVFRPQIQFIIQGFVYSYLQYSFKDQYLASYSRLSFEYEVKCIIIAKIQRYCTSKNAPILSHSDLDLQHIDPFLYGSIPYMIIYQYQ